ncbi:MAG: hypothetical protein HQL82_02015 [Magnetococcales bacterium]|nr:hypothetical protein [Magnetococcales bacterium]
MTDGEMEAWFRQHHLPAAAAGYWDHETGATSLPTVDTQRILRHRFPDADPASMAATLTRLRPGEPWVAQALISGMGCVCGDDPFRE